MAVSLRSVWRAINATYWFYPALFAVAGVALALLTIQLDRTGWSTWLAGFEAIAPARPQGASNLLTVIAGSMIGVASTVFSITIAAVAYASGTYGPRLLTNFMEDKGNQLSLATFIGTFVYALTVLRTVRLEGEAATVAEASALPGFVPQLSLLVASALMGVSVAVLVFFLNHIPSSIRINAVLEGIGRRLLASIDRRFPDPHRGHDRPAPPTGRPVIARETGYIQYIDYAALEEWSEKHGRKVTLAVRSGDFVHPRMVLATVDGDQPESADAGRSIERRMTFAGRRAPGQDLQFLIDELVEITLRALSPGINDPFTAITALHWIGAATAELGWRDLRPRPGGAASGDHVLALSDDYSHFVARGFGAARGAAATNRLVAVAQLDCILNAATTLDDASRLARLTLEARLLIEQARLELGGPELAEVEARHARFEQRIAS